MSFQVQYNKYKFYELNKKDHDRTYQAENWIIEHTSLYLNMRTIFMTLLLLLLPLGAWAQYNAAGSAKRAGTHIRIDGEKLSPEAQADLLADINGVDFNPEWQKAKAGHNAGLGLTIGGGIAMLGGSVAALLGVTASVAGATIGAIAGSIGGEQGAQQGAQQGATAGKPLATGGLIAAGAGLASMGAGIPLLIVNNKRMNGIVNAFNDGKSEAQLSLGPTGNGFGITIDF